MADKYLTHASNGPAFGLVAVCAGWKRALDEHFADNDNAEHEKWMAVQDFVNRAQQHADNYISELEKL